MKDEQRVLAETDFLSAMAELVMALRDLLHKIDDLHRFMEEHSYAVRRIESKIDTVLVQTIKEEEIKDGSD